MTAIPEKQITIQSLIFAAKAKEHKQEQRPHLGASQIGRRCVREIQYSFRWAKSPEFDGRMLYLFDRGNREEAFFSQKLRSIGVEVHEVDPATGKQFHFNHPWGHFGGSGDGIGKFIPEGGQQWHILEYKTHNAKSFEKLKTHGVRYAKPEHYAQMQIYMGLSGGITRALYGAVNKDDDDLYFERVKYDEQVFLTLCARAMLIVQSAEWLGRISEDPESEECRFCLFKGICHFTEKPERNCRTCRFSKPIQGGEWGCERHLKMLTTAEQRLGCGEYDEIKK